jgi:hypothetical protein
MASLRSHVGRDVAVVIGATRAKSSQPVAPDAFLNWLRLTTLDISGLTYHSCILSTPHGDLVLHPSWEVSSITRDNLDQFQCGWRIPHRVQFCLFGHLPRSSPAGILAGCGSPGTTDMRGSSTREGRHHVASTGRSVGEACAFRGGRIGPSFIAIGAVSDLAIPAARASG